MDCNKKNNNKKKYYIVAGIFLMVLLVIGGAYAYWTTTKIQNDQNIVGTTCLSLVYENVTDGILLEKAYPISDTEGKALTGYTFKLTNGCDSPVSYNVNLESLSKVAAANRIGLGSLDFTLNNVAVKKVNDASLTDVTSVLDEGEAYASKRIESNILAPYESKVYTLRVWIDKDAPNTEMNKSWKGKITIGGEPADTNNCAPYPVYTLGDVNMDGSVTSDDKTMFDEWVAAGVSSTYFNINQKSLADVNTDGSLDASDASFVAQYIVNSSSVNMYKKGDLNKDGVVDSDDVQLFDKTSTNNTIKVLGDMNLDGTLTDLDLAYLNAVVDNNCVGVTRTAVEELADTDLGGSDPNNYVSFSGSLWRIVGIFNVEGSSTDDGSGEIRMKITTDEPLENPMAWSDSEVEATSIRDQDVHISKLGVKKDNSFIKNIEAKKLAGYYNRNNWNYSSLKDYLNGSYFEGLSDADMVDTAKFYLGGIAAEYYDGETNFWMNKDYSYDAERNINNVYGVVNYNDLPAESRAEMAYILNPGIWIGNVGLLYPSDFGAGIGGSIETTNEENVTSVYGAHEYCDTFALGDNYYPAECIAVNWLFDEYEIWTITAANNNDSDVFTMNHATTAPVSFASASESKYVRPALYLKTSVKIIGGTGAKLDPFILSL